jgi:hypothetical protein
MKDGSLVCFVSNLLRKYWAFGSVFIMVNGCYFDGQSAKSAWL